MKRAVILCTVFFIAGLVSFFPSQAEAATNWTDQVSPINYMNFADIEIADFTNDGIIDVVAANPEAGNPYSLCSGLPVWIGTVYYQNNRWNWALSLSSSPTGRSPTRVYADPGNIGNLAFQRVLVGNTGNMMATWTVTKHSDADIGSVTSPVPVTVTKVGDWPDFWNTRYDTWRFTYNATNNEYRVNSTVWGNQENDLYDGVDYVSDHGQIGIRLTTEYPPDNSAVITVTTTPAGFVASASYHSHPEAVLLDENQQGPHLGVDFVSANRSFAFVIDPHQIDPDAEAGDSFTFTSPGGPFTNEAYVDVETADFNRDGHADIIACGPNGIDLFFHKDPELGEIGFFPASGSIPPGYNPKPVDISLTRLRSLPSGYTFENNPNALSTELWTMTYSNGKWNINGEISGDQPQFDPGDPYNWEGTWCSQFEINFPDPNFQFRNNDRFRFSTYSASWSADQGPDVSDSYSSISVADFNRDGVYDLVASKSSGGIDVFYYIYDSGTDTYYWLMGSGPQFSGQLNQLKTKDLNRDGYVDIAAVSAQGIHLWRGLDDLLWATDSGPVSAQSFISLTLGDFNKDGFFDIAATSTAKSIFVYYLREDGSWFTRVKASIPEKDRANIGNGAVSAVKVSNSVTVSELWTLTCTQAAPDSGSFQVRGDISGVEPTLARVNELFQSSDGSVEFTIYDGDVDYVVGDKFTFLTSRGPLSYLKYDSITTGDLDNDGNLDLFAANNEGNGLRVWLGNGNYGWTAETPATDQNSWNRILGSHDINFDGNPDILASSSTFGGLHTWIGDDMDKFRWTGWLYFPVALGSYAKLTHGDFNNDGKVDIVAANIENNKDGIWVWEGDNLGNFINQPGPTNKSKYYSVAAADINLDGRTDIVAGHDSDGFDCWLSQPDWGWTASTSSVSTGSVWDVSIVDIDRNGAPDVATAQNYLPGSYAVIVYLNDGHGYFDSTRTITATSTQFNHWDVASADFDHNGWPDLVCSQKVGNPGIRVLWSNTNETTDHLDCEYYYYQTSGFDHFYGICVDDFNKDSQMDFVAGEDGHGLTGFFGRGSLAIRHTTCTFDSVGFGSSQIRDVTSADLTNDGVPDVVAASKGAGVSAFRSNLQSPGASNFANMTAPATDGDYIGVTIADVNGDGLRDIIAASEGSGASGINLWVSNRDFTMLKIQTHFPASGGEFNIGADRSITMKFSKAVDFASVTYENIQLKRDTILVPYSLFATSTTEIRLDPIGFQRDVEYTVTIRGGSDGLRDALGNMFDGNGDSKPQEPPADDYQFTFTTVDHVAPSVPTHLTSQPIDRGVIISWAANNDPTLDKDLTGYWLCRKYADDETSYIEHFYTKEECGLPPVVTVRGLDYGRPMQFAIVSEDGSQNYSDYSEWIEATPSSQSPQLWWAGYYTSNVSYAQGGPLSLLAYVYDVQNDANSVEIYFGGMPTGVMLYDDGNHGDFSAGDGIFGFTLSLLPGQVPSGSYLLELVAHDAAGNSSFLWPYMHIHDDLPGQSGNAGHANWMESQEHRFQIETSIPWGASSAGPGKPQIWLAGFQANPTANFAYGPKHALTAIISDSDGPSDIVEVQLYYAGIPLGMMFSDAGEAEDFAAGDTVWGLDLTMNGSWQNPEGPYLPVGPLALEIRARDQSGNVSDAWPYLVSH